MSARRRCWWTGPGCGEQAQDLVVVVGSTGGEVEGLALGVVPAASVAASGRGPGGQEREGDHEGGPELGGASDRQVLTVQQVLRKGPQLGIPTPRRSRFGRHRSGSSRPTPATTLAHDVVAERRGQLGKVDHLADLGADHRSGRQIRTLARARRRPVLDETVRAALL